MSVITKADSCGDNTRNISRTNCAFNQKLVKGFLVSKNLNKVIPLTDLQDQATVEAMLASGELYYFPRIVGVNADNTPDIAVTQNKYGSSFTGSTAINTSINFKISTSECMMRNLKTWDKVTVAAFPIYEDESIGGILTDINGVLNYKGQESFFVFSKPKYRTNNTDEFKASMIWVADNDQLDDKVATDFILGLDGIIDTTFVIDTANTNTGQLVVAVSEGCNGSAIEGLLLLDFVIEDALGVVVVPSGMTEATGTYTFTFAPALAAGTYSVNFATSTVSVPGSTSIYGAQDVACTFTV